MALTKIIRFKVTPKFEARAQRVLRLRNAGKVNPETLSDVGRAWFAARLQQEEAALGIAPAQTKEAA